MRFHVITIFPEMLSSYLEDSIIARAIASKKIHVTTYPLRDYTEDKHRRVDGKPYGGGPGMVLWVDPILRCVKEIKSKLARRKTKASLKVVITSPGGERFTNGHASKTVKKYTDIIIICGRYEGIDARVKKILKANEWSIGDYVLTGGELPALVFIDCIARQVDGVLHDAQSREETRVASHDVYARPEVYEYQGKNYRVPKVLLSGNHKLIEEYRAKRENKLGK